MILARSNFPSCLTLSVLAHLLLVTGFVSLNQKVDLNWERALPSNRISVTLSQLATSAALKSAPKTVQKVAPIKPKDLPVIQQKPAIQEKPLPTATTPTSPTEDTTTLNNEGSAEGTAEQANTGKGPIGTEARTNYESILANWLERYRSYPSRALKRRITGEGIIYVKINSSGNVLDYEIKQSTNQPMLDEAMIAMLKRATPLPAIPREFNLSKFEFAVPVTFQIN